MSLDLTYAALADPSRRAMLGQLSGGQRSVSQLAAPLAIALPTVMKHLDVLDRAGLIERRKTGRVVTVCLTPEPMTEATAWLERTAAFWTERLDRLAALSEKDFRMTSLTIVRRIKAPPHSVFTAFTDPARIAQWWGPDAGPVTVAEVDPRLGGSFHVKFRMEDGSEHGSTGTFETFEPPHRLEMRWVWDNETAVSRVEVQLRPIAEGTELTFRHEQLADQATRDSHEQGWNAALDKLEAAAPAW